MTKFTRNDIFRWFIADNLNLPLPMAEEIFNEMSDTDLAESYRLKILRTGVFYI